VTEHALPGHVQRTDVPLSVDCHDHVFDVIEYRLQLRAGALLEISSERRSFFGHELHRTHDTAAFVVSLTVSLFDSREQLREIELAVCPRRVCDLPV
jgi:hypothetical protein